MDDKSRGVTVPPQGAPTAPQEPLREALREIARMTGVGPPSPPPLPGRGGPVTLSPAERNRETWYNLLVKVNAFAQRALAAAPSAQSRPGLCLTAGHDKDHASSPDCRDWQPLAAPPPTPQASETLAGGTFTDAERSAISAFIASLRGPPTLKVPAEVVSAVKEMEHHPPFSMGCGNPATQRYHSETPAEGEVWSNFKGWVSHAEREGYTHVSLTLKDARALIAQRRRG